MPKTVAPQFPKTLLVSLCQDGDDTLYIASETPAGLADEDPVVARYVLVGTGAIHHSAPVYVEDAKAKT